MKNKKDFSLSSLSSSAYVLMKKAMTDVLSPLTLREQEIMKLRFGLEGERARTLEEVGHIFMLAPLTISKIETVVLRKLRDLSLHNDLEINGDTENKETRQEEKNKIAKLNVDLGIITVSNTINEIIIKKLLKTPNEMKYLDRRVFEEIVAEIFSKFGYDVELTARTKDGGRDVVAIKHKETIVKYLIECKRPEPHNKTGIVPVRALYGVKVDEKATKAILATTTSFTKGAKIFFERNKWELEPRDYDGIIDWLQQYKEML